MRKKLRWLLFALGVFATVAILAWTLLPHHRINKASFDQIKEGMTKAEVEAIFGVPPGIYCRRTFMVEMVSAEENAQGAVFFYMDDFEKTVNENPSQLELASFNWIGSDGACVIGFDVEGKVQYQRFHPVWAPSIWQRVKDWFADFKR